MGDLIKIEQPDFSSVRQEKIARLLQNTDKLKQLETLCNSPEYQSWEKVRHKATFYDDLTPEEFFFLLKITRTISSQKTPIQQENGEFFMWQELDRFQKFFHQFAKEFGAELHKNPSNLDQETMRKRFYEGIIEEAIASSQIEGATETRQQGRELLKSGKTPKNKSERMIFNNYQTILKIEKEWKNEPMSEDLLIRIQASLTKDTLDTKEFEGRFRKDADKITVSDPLTGNIAFIPPSAKFVQKELKMLIDFANEKSPFDGFVWDLARAIMLHFWIAFLHPFCDGNGRTARAVFYWYLLRKGFLYIGFLPISVRIRQSKNSYEKAFLLSEQDGSNLTYFFDYIIRQMALAIKDFYEFEEKQKLQTQNQMAFSQQYPELNTRQIELIYSLRKNPTDFTTFARHQARQSITYVTARKDLLGLEKLDFLTSKKYGKSIRFYPKNRS